MAHNSLNWVKSSELLSEKIVIDLHTKKIAARAKSAPAAILYLH